jgi:uncharacterized cofD-like protein
VALGGGTGLPVLLRGLKARLFPAGRRWVAARDRGRLTAIVTAADDGGSSGRLRRAYRVLPPGDIRNCLLALSEAKPTLAGLFDYRFGGDGGVGGHSLGNLILAALSHLERDFVRAVERANDLLAVRGQVLPATLDEVTVTAELRDGRRVEGESRIATACQPVDRIDLDPPTARALPAATAAIEAADLVVLAPGSLYTSLLPVLLVRDLSRSIARSRARVLLVMNLMTEPGETDGYGAADVVRAIHRHVPEVGIDDVLVNVTPIPEAARTCYAHAGAEPILPDLGSLRALGCRPVARDLLDSTPAVRHDAEKLARAVLDVALEARP